MALSDRALWECVKGLKGKTVCTIIQRSPNRILDVTDNAVEIDGKSKVSRKQIWCLYDQVHNMGQVMAPDAWKWTRAVTYAILVKVVPHEVEAVSGKLLGIRLIRHLT